MIPPIKGILETLLCYTLLLYSKSFIFNNAKLNVCLTFKAEHLPYFNGNVNIIKNIYNICPQANGTIKSLSGNVFPLNIAFFLMMSIQSFSKVKFPTHTSIRVKIATIQFIGITFYEIARCIH